MTEQQWLTNEDPAAMLSHLQWEVSRTRHYQSDDYSTSRSRRNPPLITDRQLKLWVEACRMEHDRISGNKTKWQFIDNTDMLEGVIESWITSGSSLANEWKAALIRDIAGNPFRPVKLWQVVTAARDMSSKALESGAKEEWVPLVPWLTPTVQQIAAGIYGGKTDCFRCDGTQKLDNSNLPRGWQYCPHCKDKPKLFDPSGMPILADALEEAGCTDEVILHHLRGEEPVLRPMQRMTQMVGPDLFRLVGWRPLRGPHVRGCWVIDTILGHQ